MPHNGGRFQTQPWFLYIYGIWPFMNKLKVSQGWSAGASGRPAASILSANGYPSNATINWQIIVDDEGLTYRPGKRVLAWDGTATFTVSGASLSSGSLSGTNGRAVLTLSNSVSPKTCTITITATDGTLDNMRWLHEDDESIYNLQKSAFPNKEPFGTKFLEVVQNVKPGVWRFLDWQLANSSNIVSWSQRTPIGHYSYAVSHFPPELYGGVLGGSSPTLTATQSGFSLVDGATVIVDITNTTVVSGTPTLNVSSTGAKAIKNPDGSAWSRSSSGTNTRGTFTYVSLLDAYVIAVPIFDEGISGGMPPEVMIDFCNIVGCHGHFLPPAMTCEGPSDYMASLAAYARDNLDEGLQYRVEGGPNECWNNIFLGTSLARTYATARWGVANIEDWYGRVSALHGANLSAVFGGDTSRYALLCGFQTTSTPDAVAGANTARRIESTRHVSDGGTPAKNYFTHICPAAYWATLDSFGALFGTTNEKYLRMVAYVAKARDWAAGDGAAKSAIVNSFFSLSSIQWWMDNGMEPRLSKWTAVADQYGYSLTGYEGGYYPGDIDADPVHGIDGVTLGNPTVITINKINSTQAHAFVAGMTCRFRSIGGTAQLNGNTYTVLSVTDTTVTIDVDSTSFGTFTSGGSGGFGYGLGDALVPGIIYNGYGNTGARTLNAFQNATKAAHLIYFGAQEQMKRCTASEMEYPPDYMLLGGDNQWSKYLDIYSDPSPQVDALLSFNDRKKRLVIRT